jgi:hypothetical protein
VATRGGTVQAATTCSRLLQRLANCFNGLLKDPHENHAGIALDM